ncbi:MAG: DUF4097 family beta strand repeat protein [Candidatus Delongbacteria bacterium]|nr:DUF4097 family beta strand repeat protein [Candidatus Delongbacteria bacterium]
MNYSIDSDKFALKLNLVDGDIEIHGEERNDIELELGDLRKNTAEEIFDIKFENNELTIIQKDSKKLLKTFNVKDVDVVIKVPSGVKLSGEVKNVSGDISIHDIAGLVSGISTRNGDVQVVNVGDIDINVNIVNGDLKASNFIGAVKANNVNGDVSIAEGVYRQLGINNVNGDISISGEFDLEEDAKIKIVSGDISINSTKFTSGHKIYINSVTGDNNITGDFPEDAIVQQGGLKELKNLQFLKDSIQPMIKQFKEHFKFMPHEKVKEEVNPRKNNEENIQMILKMLSEGKINAEDAEKLISALNK